MQTANNEKLSLFNNNAFKLKYNDFWIVVAVRFSKCIITKIGKKKSTKSDKM